MLIIPAENKVYLSYSKSQDVQRIAYNDDIVETFDARCEQYNATLSPKNVSIYFRFLNKVCPINGLVLK